MKKIFLFAFLLFSICFGKAAFAQINLVENPSFEDLVSHDSVNFPWINIVKNWHGTDTIDITNTPDIFFTYPNQL